LLQLLRSRPQHFRSFSVLPLKPGRLGADLSLKVGLFLREFDNGESAQSRKLLFQLRTLRLERVDFTKEGARHLARPE
jgi:hypothetical protein